MAAVYGLTYVGIRHGQSTCHCATNAGHSRVSINLFSSVCARARAPCVRVCNPAIPKLCERFAKILSNTSNNNKGTLE